MLTPSFELKQDQNYLTIIIRAPFAKISETEIFIEENDFKFYSSPYYLRLTLPGNIVEDSREKGDYDAATGVFTIRVPKEIPGEHFEGLDMLTKLLAPKGQRTAAQPLIQVIEPEPAENGEQADTDDSTAGSFSGGLDEETEEDEFDWAIEQTPFTEQASPLDAPKYGFANQKSGVFQRLQEELQGIVDVPDPDQLPIAERRELRIKAENDKFDADHYIADLYDDELIQPLLSYEAPWTEELQEVKQGATIQEAVIFTDEEKDKMRNLPRKEYLLDEKEETFVFLGLVDIIYAYCYNHRTTEGENNVESSWTISRLSATLSWLEIFNSLQDVAVCSVRRSLCYPLFRHRQLSNKVLSDVRQVFKLGQRRLLKCLLEIHSMLIDTESRYILNDLYITDYCVWIQSASEVKISSLAEALNKVTISKNDIGFDLEELEREAASLYEDKNIEEITTDIEKLAVKPESDSGTRSNSETNNSGPKGHKLDSDDTENDTSESVCLDESDSISSGSDDTDSASNDDDGKTVRDIVIENKENTAVSELEVHCKTEMADKIKTLDASGVRAKSLSNSVANVDKLDSVTVVLQELDIKTEAQDSCSDCDKQVEEINTNVQHLESGSISQETEKVETDQVNDLGKIT